MKQIFSREVVIDAPIDVVWETFSSFERYAQDWMPEVEAARLVGELAAGQGIEVRVRGKEIRSTILELEAPRRCVLESVQGKMRAVYEYGFEAASTGTRVSLDARCEAGGVLLRLMQPIITRAIERVDGPSIDNLKRFVESR